MKKVCKKCGIDNPLSQFSISPSLSSGLSNKCKRCCSDYALARARSRDGLVTKIHASQKERSRRRGHSAPDYDLQGLRQWVFNQDNFETLFSAWEKSGYERMLSPSVDRLDDFKGYSFDNIRLVSWQENLSKQHMDIHLGKGTSAKVSAPVSQYSLAGDYIASYRSKKAAALATGTPRTGISNCISGLAKTSGGYRWKDAEQGQT